MTENKPHIDDLIDRLRKLCRANVPHTYTAVLAPVIDRIEARIKALEGEIERIRREWREQHEETVEQFHKYRDERWETEQQLRRKITKLTDEIENAHAWWRGELDSTIERRNREYGVLRDENQVLRRDIRRLSGQRVWCERCGLTRIDDGNNSPDCPYCELTELRRERDELLRVLSISDRINTELLRRESELDSHFREVNADCERLRESLTKSETGCWRITQENERLRKDIEMRKANLKMAHEDCKEQLDETMKHTKKELDELWEENEDLKMENERLRGDNHRLRATMRGRFGFVCANPRCVSWHCAKHDTEDEAKGGGDDYGITVFDVSVPPDATEVRLSIPREQPETEG